MTFSLTRTYKIASPGESKNHKHLNMKTVQKTFDDGTEITAYTATMIAEEENNVSLRDGMAAWAFLIRTGLAWSLQGWFGRRANDLIIGGIISPTGEIDWNTVDELLDI